MCKLIVILSFVFCCKVTLAQTTQVFTYGKRDTAFVKFTQSKDTSQILIRLSYFYVRENRQFIIPYSITILNKGTLEKPKFIYIGKNVNRDTYQQYAKSASYYDRKTTSRKDALKQAIEIFDAFSYGGKVQQYCFTGYKLSKVDLHQKIGFTLVPKLGLLALTIHDGGDMVDLIINETYKLNTINNVKAELYFKQVCNTQKK